MRNILVLFFLLSLNLLGQDYRCMYIRDNDGFVNVRQEASSTSAVIDSLYNLKILMVKEQPTNGWYQLVGREGFVHQSRLKTMPKQYEESLLSTYEESLTSVYNNNLYLMTTDCPQLVVNIEADDRMELIEKSYIDSYNENLYKDVFLITKNLVGHIIIDLSRDVSDNIIDERYAITPLKQLIIYQGRIIFQDHLFEYYFYKNSEDITCRNIKFYDTIENQLTSEETAELLKLAKTVQESSSEFSGNNERSSAIEKLINLNNFELLSKLENIYLSGNKEIRKYYPYILNNFPTDGEGTNAIAPYFYRQWAYQNRGETPLHKILDYTFKPDERR